KDKAVYWDGSNDNGEKVASGVYFYNIETTNFSITRKMIILR
ncbi:T9SS type A sorting domain-containing protein, partial [Candidatus Poribacteria bacterium]|nr:T9SS type A sorting domain-containing protein [Candidatus Poribacteria bacterium]